MQERLHTVLVASSHTKRQQGEESREEQRALGQDSFPRLTWMKGRNM